MRFTLLHRSGLDIEKFSSYPPFPLGPVLRFYMPWGTEF